MTKQEKMRYLHAATEHIKRNLPYAKSRTECAKINNQEEIREVTSQAIRIGICAYQHLGFGNLEMYNKIADKVHKAQQRKGVVIKVEKELPDEYDCPYEGHLSSANWMKEEMLKWHNDSLEPLIKED